LIKKDRYLIISDDRLKNLDGYKVLPYSDYLSYVKNNNFDILILEENSKTTVELLHILSQLFLLNKEKIILIIDNHKQQDEYLTYMTLGITDIVTCNQIFDELKVS
jgi:hypothetical protein